MCVARALEAVPRLFQFVHLSGRWAVHASKTLCCLVTGTLCCSNLVSFDSDVGGSSHTSPWKPWKGDQCPMALLEEIRSLPKINLFMECEVCRGGC
jgi:hypothetical protein